MSKVVSKVIPKPFKNVYEIEPQGKYVTFAVSTKGRHQEMEEYLIYDLNSFVADVGGYLGLLLGQSLYGIYQLAASKLT